MSYRPYARSQLVRALACAASLAGMTCSHAVGVTDPAGDFLPTFAGSTSSLDLDVIDATVVYNLVSNTVTLSSTQAGAVGSTPTGFYIWGVNKGAGAAAFAANGLEGVRFDSVVRLNPNGTGSIGATALPAGAVQISGAVISATFSATLLPSTGFAPRDYTWNLWPRDGAVAAGFTQISDFAPNNANFTASVVPEPATWALWAAGLGAVALRRRAAAVRG